MKNYIIKPGYRGLFSIDKENGDIDVIKSIYTHIDWVYVVPEDGVLKMPDNTNKDVTKGNIVISFYTSPYTKNPVVVIESSEWSENVYLESEYNRQQEEAKKQEEAKRKEACGECCDKCRKNCTNCEDDSITIN